jgi:branched-chain amino acid transport system ATP-binding protein
VALLEVQDMHSYYGSIHALRGISLTVEEGEVVTLIGSNGAGKTTTLRSINGVLPARQGKVIFDAEEIQGVPAMSGGEQQMLAIGRALMSSPKLLLLDEPSMGLAPVLVERIFDIIKEINHQGTTILLVEQNANVALEIATRGYVLESGSIVNAAPAEKLRQDPKVREAYLGEI